MSNRNLSYSLIGYAFGASATIAGCREGPRVLRERGLLEKLERLQLRVSDLGDVTPELEAAQEEQIMAEASPSERTVNKLAITTACCRALAAKTTGALNAATCPIILGGDHSSAIGSIAALSNYYNRQKRDVGLIWIDTHPDINTPESSPSKHIFGMSVAVLLGLVPGVLAGLQEKQPAIKPDKLVYIGLREIDPGEKELINKLGIHAFTIKEIDMLGISTVVQQAVKIASKRTAGFAVSFDLDVCDPRIVPGTGTPCRGGLTFREAHLLLELLYDSQKMLSLGMLELNPILDTNFETADLAVSLIESACGKSIL